AAAGAGAGAALPAGTVRAAGWTAGSLALIVALMSRPSSPAQVLALEFLDDGQQLAVDPTGILVQEGLQMEMDEDHAAVPIVRCHEPGLSQGRQVEAA